jgi:glutamyl-tRNA synthetase
MGTRFVLRNRERQAGVSMIRGRFAPTPSGELHIGNAMTALLSWLQIRHAGGTFVLRMEDLDGGRTSVEFSRQIINDLKWLGIDWDEGPDVGGPYAPYDQSERIAFYQEAFERLDHEGRLYACFCSRKELRAVASAPHGLSSLGPAYPGTCRHLTPAERTEKAKRKSPSFRFAMPDRPITFEDLVVGKRAYPAGFGGDFVVKRADGLFSYQLAVVVDDALMGMTDVLRGNDLLDSTPRQVLLFEALGLPTPRFAHVPLLYGPDRKRLSKQHESQTLASLRARGTTPEQLVGCLAYLTGLIDKPQSVKANELISEFDLDKIPKKRIRISETLLQGLTTA